MTRRRRKGQARPRNRIRAVTEWSSSSSGLRAVNPVGVLTTNYLIRSCDVWVRRGDLVKPTATRPTTGSQTYGLAGTHRKIAETLAGQLAQRAGLSA